MRNEQPQVIVLSKPKTLPPNDCRMQRQDSPVRQLNLMRDAEEIQRIFQRAVNHALWMHKRLGNPIAIWKDGKVVIIPPEEIVVDPTSEPERSPNPDT